MQYLNKWIYEKINPVISKCKKKYNFERDSLFLSFNYTDTLEKLYSINRSDIVYLHGKSDALDSELAFGSSIEPCSFNYINPDKEKFKWSHLLRGSKDINSLLEYIKIPEYINIDPCGVSMVFYKNTIKYAKSRILLEKYDHIQEIHVIGHNIGRYCNISMKTSGTDDYYYEFLLNNLKNLNTVVVYEYDNTAKNKVQKLKEFNNKIDYIILQT